MCKYHCEVSEKVWTPNLFGKQWDIFNSRQRILLVCGSRKSGKSIGVEHRVCRHLWETPGARIAIFSKSIKLAKEGGSWQTLIESVIPQWIAGGYGFNFTTHDSDGVPGPKQDSVTRTSFFRVRNYFGGESEARLFSIDHDDDVAFKVKNKEFSMIWFIELSMFKDRRILSVTLPSLRMPHLRPKDGEDDTNHMWIADTNPDEELGAKSWFYDEWYQRRIQDFAKSENKQERDNASNLNTYYKSFGLIEMFTSDNPYITHQEMIELEGSCCGDPYLYDSYVLGKHGDGGQRTKLHFADVFNRNQHIVGQGEGPTAEIVVSKETSMLHTGWDIGGVNHAAVILEKRLVRFAGKIVSMWCCLDELVMIDDRETDIAGFGAQMLMKMDDIETVAGRKFEWRHLADESATTVWRPTSASYDYIEIQKGTHNRITLEGVNKPEGSIAVRVRLLRKLIREGRFFVAFRCEKIIDMLENISKGKTDLVPSNKWKHPFDALTYPLLTESIEELDLDVAVPQARSSLFIPVG